jgi:hypothetical protein
MKILVTDRDPGQWEIEGENGISIGEAIIEANELPKDNGVQPFGNSLASIIASPMLIPFSPSISHWPGSRSVTNIFIFYQSVLSGWVP